MDQRYLKPTRLPDFDSWAIRRLIGAQGWMQLAERDRIGAVYDFVRDQIAFGFKGVNRDFGVFDDPDTFYAQYGANLRGVRRLLFVYLIRHLMNANVRTIRTLAGRCGPNVPRCTPR